MVYPSFRCSRRVSRELELADAADPQPPPDRQVGGRRHLLDDGRPGDLAAGGERHPVPDWAGDAPPVNDHWSFPRRSIRAVARLRPARYLDGNAADDTNIDHLDTAVAVTSAELSLERRLEERCNH